MDANSEPCKFLRNLSTLYLEVILLKGTTEKMTPPAMPLLLLHNTLNILYPSEFPKEVQELHPKTKSYLEGLEEPRAWLEHVLAVNRQREERVRRL